jgi:hypothetical protein
MTHKVDDIPNNPFEQNYPIPEYLNEKSKDKDKKITIQIIIRDTDEREYVKTEIEHLLM